jgi:hypothetical protein
MELGGMVLHFAGQPSTAAEDRSVPTESVVAAGRATVLGGCQEFAAMRKRLSAAASHGTLLQTHEYKFTKVDGKQTLLYLIRRRKNLSDKRRRRPVVLTGMHHPKCT